MSDQDSAAHFTVKGDKYPCPNPEDLDFGEMEFIEQTAGVTFVEAADGLLRGHMGSIKAFCIVAMRRSGKHVTVNQFNRLYKLRDLELDVDERAAEDPPNGAVRETGAESSADGSPAEIPVDSGSPSTDVSTD